MAVDISFGSSGFKMMIATMSKQECYEVRVTCTNEMMFTILAKINGRRKQLRHLTFITILPLLYQRVR